MVFKLWDSCKKLEKHLSNFIEGELYNIKNESNFVKLKDVDKLFDIDHIEFGDMIEPILALE